jgi:hypothetical protein
MPVRKLAVETLTSDNTVAVVKFLLSTLIPVTNVPVLAETPVTAEAVVKSLRSTLIPDTKDAVLVDTPVIADAVVKSLLSTLIPVTNVPVEAETDSMTLVVEATTSVSAVPVDRNTPCECPAYGTTLPAVTAEYVNSSPSLIGASATACATPNTMTLTLPPALAESIAIPTMFGYVVEDG